MQRSTPLSPSPPLTPPPLPPSAPADALRAPGSALLWLRPAVSVSVGAASAGCQLSHCQAGVLTVDPAGASANGTFITRKDYSATFPVSASVLPSAAGEGAGSQLVEVAVQTPLGFSCPLVFSGDAAAALAAPTTA